MKTITNFFSRAVLACGLLFLLEGNATMAASETILSPNDEIMISSDALESDDPNDLILSNVDVVNMLFEEYLEPDEISRNALLSYYVDFYLAEVNNGGFLQFVFNSSWNDEIIDFVRTGLREMGATRNLSLFDEAVSLLEGLDETGLQAFLQDYENLPRNSELRDRMNSIDERFYDLAIEEDLVERNTTWLKSRSNLRVLSPTELTKEVARRSAAVPDRQKRIEAALESQPQYFKLISALCEKSGQRLEHITAGSRTLLCDGNSLREMSPQEIDRMQDDGAQAAPITWYFITDKGLHLMAECDGEAIMFDDATKTKVAEIEIPGQP